MKPDRSQRNQNACNSSASEEKRKPGIDRRVVIAASVTALVANGSSFPACAETAPLEMEIINQPQATDDGAFMQRAFDMRQRAVDFGDQAYGAIVVRDNVIIGQSWSRVVLDGDPTAHAEMATIRNAAQRTGNRDLDGSVMYSSSRPCPMCEAAAYWAGIDELIHGRAMSKTGPPVLCR
jgi:tRNA(Arg) A34 adenosine deaminase TadA